VKLRLWSVIQLCEQNHVSGSSCSSRIYLSHGEPLDFDKDYVMVDGAYLYSKTGNPTAADMKQGLRAFLAG